MRYLDPEEDRVFVGFGKRTMLFMVDDQTA